jgi:hypothetical protein
MHGRSSRLLNVRVALPLRFDTSGVAATMLRGGLGLLLVLLAGSAYSFFVSREAAAGLGLLGVGALVAYFVRRIVWNLTGSRGTITSDAVIVQAVRVCTFRLAGPEGAFPLDRFEAVRVERASAPMEGTGGPHARVYLVGRGEMTDVLVARADLEEGRVLGRDLATTLALPFEEASVPY